MLQIVAVAARNLDSANNFAKTYSIPNAYEGYEKLAADPQIGTKLAIDYLCHMLLQTMSFKVN